jgi:mannose-6-phosphate isomerase
MSLQQPLVFRPLFMERVWGGRRMETRLGRRLPASAPVGESWEIADRKDAQSTVESGELAGTTLHQLWTTMREEVFGRGLPDSARFPVLAKILDAKETLSVQVHPPHAKAKELGGEPKTEMWYLLDADPGAELMAGFRKGTTRESFERALTTGGVAELLHRLPVRAGDAMFIPSGRCLIIEIQQNSDTTFRVFDWNRTGLDGKPRALHVAESLASIDFSDHEPALLSPCGETLISCPEFHVELWNLTAPRADEKGTGSIFTVIDASIRCGGRTFRTGDFFLLPAACRERTLSPSGPRATVLRTTIPTVGGQRAIR